MVLEEKTLSSSYIYKGTILNLRKDQVTTRNGTSTREIVEHGGGAAIAALDEEGRLIMVRQYRKAAESFLLEVPAGKREGEEPFLETAKRELQEETGYVAKEMLPLTSMYLAPGYSEEVLALFLATGLTSGKMHLDPNEAIDCEAYALPDLKRMIRSGEIRDAKTIVAVLATEDFLREHPHGAEK